jgi:DNA-binding HxlR family transcriptional regulator
MNDASESTAAIARELWQRFRLLAMVIDRTDSFVAMTPVGEPLERRAEAQVSSRWLKALANNHDEMKAIADDLVLRALRMALEPTNFAILLKLREQPAVSFPDLMQATQLNRLSLSERVNDLIQAGLAVKDVQTGQVQGTKAAAALVEFIQQAQEDLFGLILKKLPELAGD